MINLLNKNFLKIQQPAQYLGNELGLIHKDWEKAKVKWCLAFPDLYSLGMSYYGHKLLYFYLNSFDSVLADRVYCPNFDFAEYLSSNSLPLSSVTYQKQLKDFNVIGFSITYELNYTNLLWMLDLAGIPLQSSQRSDEDPLIIVGGHCTVNPEPLSKYLDVVCVGEGELFIEKINDILLSTPKTPRDRLLQLIASNVPGAYVPSLYEQKLVNNYYSAIVPKYPSAPYPIKRTYIKEYPTLTTDITPLINVPDARPVVEIMRGCPGNCRFCQAGYITRPIRPLASEKVIKTAIELVQNTGVQEIALLSLSTLDHPEIDIILEKLNNYMKTQNGSLNLPSLRVDSVSVAIAQKLGQDLGSSLTFAPESGSSTVLKQINKNISSTAILETLSNALNNGYHKFKLYLMHGFTNEAFEIEENAELIERIAYISKQANIGIRQLNISLNLFIPKPFTPLQWQPMLNEEKANDNLRYFRQRLSKYHFVKIKWHDTRYSKLEGILCQSGREIEEFIYEAYKSGLVLQSWSEHFNWDKWQSLINSYIPYLNSLLYQPKDPLKPLAWDHIDIGIKKSYLISEYEKFKLGQNTPKCSVGCSGCGLLCFNK